VKKILVISYPYFPRHKASSICLESVLNELVKDYSIDVLTLNDEPYLEESESINSIRIFRVKRALRVFNNRLLIRVQEKLNGLLRPLFWMDDGIYWMNRAYKKSKQLFNDNQYDFIISSSGTFSTQNIAMKLKKKFPCAKWIAYIVDPYPTNNPRIRNFHFYNAKHLTKEAVKKADGIAILPNLLVEYSSNYLKLYLDKCASIDIPLLTEISNDKKYKKNKKDLNLIDLVFVGSLSKDIRNPEYLLSLLENIVKSNFERRIRFIIYGGQQDCKDIIEKYSEILGENLIINDHVPREEVLEAMKKANVLINIGNTSPYMVPSKIFEYMGTGLPIVNIESIDSDSSRPYLDRYGLSLSIKSDWNNININAEKLYRFCVEHEDSYKSFSEIEKLFIQNTSKHAAWKIDELMRYTEIKK